ncbi:hypothetical protein KXW10_000401 [Aspergillus fumigatus]|nr:hypothetical protein KXW10_000401 [Aspergillus fumigatus]
MIMNQRGSKEERAMVKATLKQDVQAGKRWYTYATELGGYGVFFLIGVVPSWVYEITLNQTDDLKFVISHFKSLKVLEIADQHRLHMVGRRILSEIEARTESCIPPKRTAKKRKRPAHRPTASNSVLRQTEDCRASNGSRSPFQRVRLSRSSASPRQASTPMTNSVRDERSVFFDEADGGNGDVIEVSAQHSLAESSLEGDGLNDQTSQRSCWDRQFLHGSQNLPPSHYGGLGQFAGQQQPNSSNHAGFFNVSQAFQGVSCHPGYDDTAQAMRYADFLTSSGPFFGVMQDTASGFNAESNQMMDQPPGIHVAGTRTDIGGYYNVYQAVHPSSLPGFTDASLAIQDS